jgi:hypothetical protein
VIKQIRVFSFFAVAALLTGCTSGYIQVERIKTDKSTFASVFARSPDPRLLNPPKGEKLYINWSLPMGFSSNEYRLKVDLIFRNLTTETLLFPIKRRSGARVIEILGKEFKEKEGFLSYKAEIISVDGKIVSDYTHRMWVKLILPCDGAS